MSTYTEEDQITLYNKVQATLAKAKRSPVTEVKRKKALEEIKYLENVAIESFTDKLQKYNFTPLKPTGLDILQINVGYLCNQICNHCHVNAGPARKELMTLETMNACLAALDEGNFHTVDLTGGAPEIHPDFKWFVEEISKRNVKIIVRSNLTILTFHEDYAYLPEFFKKHKIEVIASMPCYTIENVDKQRGEGVFEASIKGLQILNTLGYGVESDLTLHLVYNPGGASLPGDQMGLERDYKEMLKKNFDVVFNNLYTITNMPISRFLTDLKNQDKVEHYMHLLVDNFNLAAVENVMCRNTISVRFDGTIFDCDFNQMLHLPISGKGSKNIKDFNLEELATRTIVLKNHCYGCTAGAGSSCQGVVA
ncbi:arsenosugar biosynthesis radical SAM (seleno)protein ArsS [Flavicella sediminum]|uniref:arsenosugar biosynthesis radical SAM (seleno)protein ArsS n=1 Tax=Flavicella sediminum TaxID=2585141 RepID=UPI00111E2ABB|nr:arsenosugar biosynthesis radical SAM (seleno)protein ArsS [Flavicella sediminum]